ncbi:MAG TPA: GFA family protein [Polyangia bacterium]|jgi:hypothetical protein
MKTKNDIAPAPDTVHPGSCHCGAVRFEVRLGAEVTGSRCNCTICTKTAMTGTSVEPDAFTLLFGEDNLGAYEWGGKTGRRFFCKTCGVQCFGRGHLAEMGGDYVSINLNALDDVDTADLKMIYWDGRHDNWHAGPRPTPWPIVEKRA